MTKKHFEALATALAKFQDDNDWDLLIGEKVAAINEVAGAVADVCARFNPNFDRARFLKACGVEETT